MISFTCTILAVIFAYFAVNESDSLAVAGFTVSTIVCGIAALIFSEYD